MVYYLFVLAALLYMAYCVGFLKIFSGFVDDVVIYLIIAMAGIWGPLIVFMFYVESTIK